MEFTIKEIGCRNFVLFHQDKETASLNYKGWSSVKSEIGLSNGTIFNLDQTSMWKSKFQLKQGEKVVLNYELNWKGHFLIQSKLEEIQQNFTFKAKGFWGNTYVLVDEKENQLVQISSSFSWKGFKTTYALETTPNFDKLTQKDVLLLTLVHSIRYYMAVVAAVV